VSFQRTIRFQTIIALISATMFAGSVQAGIIFGSTDLTGGLHWDAAPRNIAGVGERSLDGGLRYSVQGGSLEAYRDLFSWTGGVAPGVAAFTAGVQQAFDFWSAVDPASGLGTDLVFVSDVNTAVVGNNTGGGGLSIQGAEIDLFGSTDAFFWNVPVPPTTRVQELFRAPTSSSTVTPAQCIRSICSCACSRMRSVTRLALGM